MTGATPYGIVSACTETGCADKRELIAVTRRLEREALAAPPARAIAVLQDLRFLTDRTRAAYAALAVAGCRVDLYGRGLQSWLATGVTGHDLDEDDPLVDQWVLVLPLVANPVVMAATDLHLANVEDLARTFSYALSREPDVVRQCLNCFS